MADLTRFTPRRSLGNSGARQRPNPEGPRLIPVDTAAAVARPDTITDTYLECGKDALGVEQQHLFAAEAEVRAREDLARAGSLGFQAEQDKLSVDRARMSADRATVRAEETAEVLGPYVRRKATSSWGYMARTSCLLTGDIAGLSGASIALGEYPALAITQAVAAGVATVTAGLAATQLRHVQQAVERKTDDLDEPLQPYAHLFRGPGESDRIRSVVLGIAGLVTVSVAVSVFALRTTIEGPLVGLTFGALAAAIALASAINSWHHADLLADAVESARHDAERADRRHRRRSGSRTIRSAEHAALQGKSIVTEHTHRGLAAAAHIEADKYRELMASPDVVGHGPATTPTPMSVSAPSTPKTRRRSA
ncbi:hypothetical protein [Mycobacterium sp. C31M]